MEFVTYADLNRDMIQALHKIPRRVDAVVGVPRSGMLVATMLALTLNLPLTDIDSFIRGDLYIAGQTKCLDGWIKSSSEAQRILVVEDSVCNGYSIQSARKKMEPFKINVTYLAAYVTNEKKNLVDIYFRVVSFPRLFEWNYMHTGFLQNACFDIDGVLCEDPTEEQNDDGRKYKVFLHDAKVKFQPTGTVGWIVSSRLEKYRDDTADWLKRNNIQYEHLILMDIQSAEERRKLNGHAQFKAQFYKGCRESFWFVESEKQQAAEIAQISGKPVFCIENQQFYDGTSLFNEVNDFKMKTQLHFQRKLSAAVPESIKKILKRILRYHEQK